MVNLTLSRGGTSVTIPLIEEGGTPLFSIDYGKPEARVHGSGGAKHPRVNDQYAPNINYVFQGIFVNDAFSRATKLADLMQEDPNGTPMTLETPYGDLPDTIDVATQPVDNALSLTYPMGTEDYVSFTGRLTEIDELQGGASRSFTTPTKAGSGPVQLQFDSDTGEKTIDLTVDIQVTREIGRPNDVIRRDSNSEAGRYYPKRKVTNDLFSLELQFIETTVTKLQQIRTDIFKSRTGRGGISLDFQGQYGLGEFSVLPVGSGPVRVTRLAGRNNVAQLPTLEFRRIET